MYKNNSLSPRQRVGANNICEPGWGEAKNEKEANPDTGGSFRVRDSGIGYE